MIDFSRLDILILRSINEGLANPLVDKVMLCLSDRMLWFFVGLLFILSALISRRPEMKVSVIALVIGIVFADLICFEVLKPMFGRLRPCHDPDLVVRMVNGMCGGLLGMPSNHATNGMTVAVIGWHFFGRSYGLPMVVIAVLVGISRVYLGVHYPTDVLAGMFFGCLFAVPSIALAKLTVNHLPNFRSKFSGKIK